MRCKNRMCLTVLLVFVSTFFLYSQKGMDGMANKWVVSKNSTLSVNGSTNVNTFSCLIREYDEVDTLTLLKSKTGMGITISGSVGLKISGFDCSNPAMTKQLGKTMKQDQFPVLRIRFLSLTRIPVLTERPTAITGMVEILIAGTSKRFAVNYIITQNAKNQIQLLGSHNVNFSDFGLVPPKKLGGLIKANDLLKVAFQMNMKNME